MEGASRWGDNLDAIREFLHSQVSPSSTRSLSHDMAVNSMPTKTRSHDDETDVTEWQVNSTDMTTR
jgi:hypothetical protein